MQNRSLQCPVFLYLTKKEKSQKHLLTSVNRCWKPMCKGIEGEEVFVQHLRTPPFFKKSRKNNVPIKNRGIKKECSGTPKSHALCKEYNLRLKAKAIFFLAKSFKPLNVVCCFISSKDLSIRSFAKHSSAKEFETTSTPSKSKTTFSSPSSNGNNCSRTLTPSILVPKYSPNWVNFNIMWSMVKSLSWDYILHYV